MIVIDALPGRDSIIESTDTVGFVVAQPDNRNADNASIDNLIGIHTPVFPTIIPHLRAAPFAIFCPIPAPARPTAAPHLKFFGLFFGFDRNDHRL